MTAIRVAAEASRSDYLLKTRSAIFAPGFGRGLFRGQFIQQQATGADAAAMGRGADQLLQKPTVRKLWCGAGSC